MQKLALSAITILIILSGNAHALKIMQVYPDYEIHVRMRVVIVDKYPLTTKWRISVRIRDMLQREYLKAWNDDTASPEDFDRSGSRELSTFSKLYGSYDDGYKVFVESVFKIAMQIQDAGLIPIIKYDGIYQTNDSVNQMFHDITEIPTGNWKSTRKAVYITKYVPDYVILSGISPVMSEDKSSVASWKTYFKIYYGNYIGTSNIIEAWSESETNLMSYNLSCSACTKDTFEVSSATWLDAQKEMFRKTYAITTKMLKNNNSLLIESQFDDIPFMSTNGVILIDLRNGVIPDGTMEAASTLFPASFDIENPVNSSTTSVSPVTFTWKSSSNATSYRLEITSSGLPNKIITTSNTYAVVDLSVSSTMRWYYWSVYAINDYGETESLSTQWFTTIQQ